MQNTDKQLQNTKRALEEIRILRELAHTPAPEEESLPNTKSESNAIPEEYEKFMHPFHNDVEIGDIRLLLQADKITYGVVLGWDPANWCIVPFSHLENPAGNDEALASGGEDRGLFQQVYQMWNARTVAKPIIQKGWTVDKLSSDELANLKTLMRYQLAGEPLPAELQDRLGTPMESFADIRNSYRSQELKNLNALSQANQEYQEQTVTLMEKIAKMWERMKDAVLPPPQTAPADPLPAFALQAAAGKKTVSGLFSETGAGLQWVECDSAFEFPLKAQNTLPPILTWTANDLPEKFVGKQLIFIDCKHDQFLGYGSVKQLQNGARQIQMESTSEYPLEYPLDSPQDIQIGVI